MRLSQYTQPWSALKGAIPYRVAIDSRHAHHLGHPLGLTFSVSVACDLTEVMSSTLAKPARLYARHLLDGASPSLGVDRDIERPPGDQQHPLRTDQGYPTRAICL